ncbi:hypothetical protein ACSBR1_029313 [Camellia fascicularis]
MEVVLLLLWTYGQTSAVVCINEGFTFAQLLDVVCGKFDISAQGWCFSCSLSLDTINSRLIVTMMFRTCYALRSRSVLIMLTCSSRHEVVCPILNGGVADCHDVNVCDVDDVLTYDMEDRADLLPLYCPYKTKMFLSAGWAYGITHVDQIFCGRENEFWMVLCKFVIECGFHFKYVKNDLVRITTVCKFAMSTGCAWLVHERVSASNGVMCLKRFNNIHSCGAALRTYKNPRIGSDLVSNVIAEHVHEQLVTRPMDVVFGMKNDFGLDISYQSWLGVEKARSEVYGDHAMSFDQLRFVCYSISFRACIDGFEHCCPLLFLDGTFLKGRFNGNMLAATGWQPSGRRYGEMWSNAAESFNDWIRAPHHLPITQFVDAIRGQIMEQMAKCKAKCSVWGGELCSKMETILESAFKTSGSWIVCQADANVFEGCSHPLVLKSGRNIYDYIDPFYHVTEFQVAYSGSIHPIPTVRIPNFSSSDYLIAPPMMKQPPQRPKRKRIPSKGEVVTRIRCGWCGKMGNNNRKTCNEPM